MGIKKVKSEKDILKKKLLNEQIRGIQCIDTPIAKIENITNFKFSSVISPEMKDFCVLFNTEFINYLIKFFKSNNVEHTIYTFIDSVYDETNINNLKNKYNYEKIVILNKNDYNITNKNVVKKLKKYLSMKKFDIVFSNPPYNKHLDLKILKSVFEQQVAAQIIFVHPSTFLLDKKFKTKLYNELRNTNYLESVNTFWGNKLFDIKLFCPCCISVWNTNKTDDKCSVTDNAFINWTGNEPKYTCKINDISIHGKIFEKVKHFLKCDNNLLTHMINENKLTDYSVKFALIRGGQEYGQGIYSHFYSIIGLDVENYKCDHTFRFGNHVNCKLHWTFNNEIERANFLNYCKSKIVRFLLSVIKVSGHIDSGELSVIPWMYFTKEWNDKKLCEEFGISEELWNYIDNFIPDYYDDYVSGF